ncbi:MAG: hypothetical protein AAGH64_09000 [Planctomycetota bacterium]
MSSRVASKKSSVPLASRSATQALDVAISSRYAQTGSKTGSPSSVRAS